MTRAMATARKPAASAAKAYASVADLMRELDHPLKAEIAAVRDVILAAHPRVAEGVKWNAPSFRVDDYFATINLRQRDALMIVLHRGAKVKDDAAFAAGFPDPSKLLTWLSPDRAVIKLRGLAELADQRAALAAVIHAWVERL